MVVAVSQTKLMFWFNLYLAKTELIPGAMHPIII